MRRKNFLHQEKRRLRTVANSLGTRVEDVPICVSLFLPSMVRRSSEQHRGLWGRGTKVRLGGFQPRAIGAAGGRRFAARGIGARWPGTRRRQLLGGAGGPDQPKGVGNRGRVKLSCGARTPRERIARVARCYQTVDG